MPSAGDRTRTHQESGYLLRTNIGDIRIGAYRAAKGPEDIRVGLEVGSERPLESNVVFNQVLQIHSTPPKSKSPTRRSPAKSTLA